MKRCPRCNVSFETVPVPCPDRYVATQTQDGLETGPGLGLSCAVLHLGERCPRCGGEVYVKP